MRKILQASLLLLVVLACVPALGQAAGRSSYSSTSESHVLALLNGIRQDHGLSAFRPSVALRGAARAHSADMIARDYFEHNSPDEAFGSRVRRYLESPLLGENIAWGTGAFGTPEGIVGLWMHSPTHRHIILMPSLHRIGLGVATGTFKGNAGAVMATADFSS